MKFENLKGLIFESVILAKNENGDVITFRVSDKECYKMYHQQDCCESVYVEDVIGDLGWLAGSPILVAEERIKLNEDGKEQGEDDYKSETWTFYEFATINGSVTIRWYGTSNGYYSESVDIYHEMTQI